ncbi:MAG TPA: hypothetical protein VIH17_06825 [Candidatus Acidoferrales bacterium]
MEHPELLASVRLLQERLGTVEAKLAAKTIELEELEGVKEAVDALRSILWITFLTEESKTGREEESLPRVLARARLRRATSILSEIRQDVLDGRIKVDDRAFLDLHRALEQSMWSLIRLLRPGEPGQK